MKSEGNKNHKRKEAKKKKGSEKFTEEKEEKQGGKIEKESKSFKLKHTQGFKQTLDNFCLSLSLSLSLSLPRPLLFLFKSKYIKEDKRENRKHNLFPDNK